MKYLHNASSMSTATEPSGPSRSLLSTSFGTGRFPSSAVTRQIIRMKVDDW